MQSLVSTLPGLLIVGAVVLPALVYGYLGIGDTIIDLAGLRRLGGAQALIWLLLPLGLVVIILVYPLVDTVISSFRSFDGSSWVGLDNFAWVFRGEMTALLWNNLLWIVLFPLLTVVLALVVALLFDKVKYERFAMSVVVLPTAISFTAASIIWRQFYSFQPAGQAQRGLFNALWTLVPGHKPIAWLQQPVLNTVCLIVVAVWASVGVAALILSAAVKNVPQEQVDAARLDGAGAWRTLALIILPDIAPTLLVVTTTEVFFALKVFDIIYVMTNGNFRTNTLANRMYYELFSANDLGHASAIAVVLLVVASPVVILNARQVRR